MKLSSRDSFCYAIVLCSFIFIGYTSSTSITPKHVHAEKSKEAQLAPIEFNLGPLGAKAQTQVGQNTFTITKIENGSPAYKAKLKVGDQIIAANGKSFANADNSIDHGGIGPLEGLGYAVDDSESTGKLTLTILREKSKKTVNVKLKKVGSFAKTYPYNCPKSIKFYNGICEGLVKSQRKDGSWKANTGTLANMVTTSFCGLALLGRGEEKLMPAIVKAKSYFVKIFGGDSFYKKGGLNNWAMAYGGIFLSEYYLASNDKTVLPYIKKLALELAKVQNPKNGAHGHGPNPVTSGYHGAGLNIITTAVMWNWALAKKCGIEVPSTNWNLAINHIKKSTGTKGTNKGGVRYVRGASGYGDASGRTGNMALALYISKQNATWAKEMTTYLARHTKRMREAHTNGSLGMISGTMALASIDPKGFRKHMDYWRWYVTLSRSVDNKAFYIGSKRNNGGDYYLNKHNVMQGLMGLMLATSQKKLYSLGGYPSIPGLDLSKLSKKNKRAYLLIKDQKYINAANLLRPLITKSSSKSATPSDSHKIWNYLQTLASNDLKPITELLKQGDIYQVSIRKNEFVKKFGAPKQKHKIYDNINAALKTQGVKPIIDSGKRYHLALSKIKTKPKLAIQYFTKIIAKPKNTNDFYLNQSKIHLKALDKPQK